MRTPTLILPFLIAAFTAVNCSITETGLSCASCVSQMCTFDDSAGAYTVTVQSAEANSATFRVDSYLTGNTQIATVGEDRVVEGAANFRAGDTYVMYFHRDGTHAFPLDDQGRTSCEGSDDSVAVTDLVTGLQASDCYETLTAIAPEPECNDTPSPGDGAEEDDAVAPTPNE